MYEIYTCDQCGRKFENKNLLKGFRLAKLGKDFCSRGCQKAYEKDQTNTSEQSKKYSSSNSFSKSIKPIIIKKGLSADEIIAEAQADEIQYQLSKKKKEDNALKPWMFDSNFSSVSNISKVIFPNEAVDVEKTILRITKIAIERIKSTINRQELGIGEFQIGTKDFLEPFSQEFEFVDMCLDKAREGQKKLKRFEENNINVMIQDCQDEIDEIINKWYPKLVEKRNKKKMKNLITVGLMLILVIIFFLMASLS